MSVISFGPQAYYYPTRTQQLDANCHNQSRQSAPALAAYYPQAGYYSTQISPPQQQQQQTQFAAPRPSDQGYDSDSYEPLLQQQQQQYSYHFQPRYPAQPQQQLHLQLVASSSTNSAAKQPSPGSSTCDSARAESPADAQLAEVTSDLEGFSLTGQRHVDMALSQTMEVVWHDRFGQFRQFRPDVWFLIPVFDQPDACHYSGGIARSQSWRYFKDQAKVRFICTSCQKAWTSMGGQVVFWIFRDAARNVGHVYFKLYGQKCTDCSPDYYEHAIWYQEEVEKVVENLFQHVGQVFYGYQPQHRRIDRRAGQPRKEHNTATCQACQENVCRMGQVLRKKMRTESTA